MRVAHVVRYGSIKGGAETYVSSVVRGLEDAGHEVRLIYALDGDTSRREVAQGRAVPTLVDPGAEQGDLRAALGELAPDVIHSHLPEIPSVTEACLEAAPTLLAVHDHKLDCPVGTRYLAGWDRTCTVDAGLRCLGFNVIAHCGSLRANVTLQPYLSWRRALESVRRTDVAVQVFSEHMAQRLGPLIGRRPLVTPYPVPRVASAGREPDRAGSDLLLAPEVALGGSTRAAVEADPRPVVYASGRLNREKGFRQLITAMTFVAERCHLVIAGDGHDRGRLEKLAASTTGGHRITFTGWIDEQERARWLSRASLVVVPSMWPEPFGIVGLEAMSAGRPVVAFDSGGISTWLEDEVTGVLVEHGDVVALGTAITRLLRDRDAAAAMGAAGEREAGERFDLADHVASLTAIYSEVRA